MPANVPVRLTVHHTGTAGKPGRSLAAKLRSLQSFSQSEEKLADGRIKQAWPDIPYHYYIAVDGSIGEGRDVRFVGDSNTEYDLAGHIQIVLEGNFEEELPTPGQIESLVALLAHLAAAHKISPEQIEGHRQFAQTACPGEHLLALLPDIRADVARRLAE